MPQHNAKSRAAPPVEAVRAGGLRSPEPSCPESRSALSGPRLRRDHDGRRRRQPGSVGGRCFGTSSRRTTSRGATSKPSSTSGKRASPASLRRAGARGDHPVRRRLQPVRSGRGRGPPTAHGVAASGPCVGRPFRGALRGVALDRRASSRPGGGVDPSAQEPRAIGHMALGAALAAYERWLDDEDAELGALLEQSFSLLAPLVDQADA
ncbi:MAG: hypothetical protein R2705_16830 [Ilumatobacteraceae bacterium]